MTAACFYCTSTDLQAKALRIEWARARARTDRWTEEVALLSEEMRQTLVYFAKRAEWWEKRATMRNGADAPLTQGLCAYAFEHAEMYRSMGQAFRDVWQPMMALAAQRFWRPGRDEDEADNVEDMNWEVPA